MVFSQSLFSFFFFLGSTVQCVILFCTSQKLLTKVLSELFLFFIEQNFNFLFQLPLLK